MDALNTSVRDVSLLEFLYADDLALCDQSLEEGRCEKWKKALEGKGLCVNVWKTKGLQFLNGKRRVTAKIESCGVCGETVGCKSIVCSFKKNWFHHHCSDILHWIGLTAVRDVFLCRSCLGLVAAEVEAPVFKYGNDQEEVVNKFCYLGDMLSSYGGVAKAVSARIAIAWKTFRELSEVLIGKQGLAPKQGGRFVDAMYN